MIGNHEKFIHWAIRTKFHSYASIIDFYFNEVEDKVNFSNILFGDGEKILFQIEDCNV